MGILSGYKRFKKYLRTGEGYRLCSEWTKSDSVEMDDGKTLQENMDDVAEDMESARHDIADVHNELKTSLGGMTFGVDAAGRYGYIKAGADTVTPFKKNDWGSISENIKYYGWYVSGNVGATMGPNVSNPPQPAWQGSSPTAEAMFGKGSVFLGISKIETHGGLAYGGIYNVIPVGIGTSAGRVNFSMRMNSTETSGFSCTVTLMGYKPPEL